MGTAGTRKKAVVSTEVFWSDLWWKEGADTFFKPQCCRILHIPSFQSGPTNAILNIAVTSWYSIEVRN